MIIHDSKIIFIHVPKTGGTTIERMLRTNKAVGEEDKSFGAHHLLRNVFNKYTVPPEEGEEDWRRGGYVEYDIWNYHIFTVTRNPWERYASLYIHDKTHYELNHKGKEFKDVEEYVNTSIGENFFRAIEVNGAIPENLMIINFDDFRNDVKRVFEAMGLKAGRIWHENKKSPKDKALECEVLSNTVFQEVIGEMCSKEIQLFAYEMPEID